MKVRFPILTELNISNMRNLQHDISEVVKNSPSLQILRMSGCVVHPFDFLSSLKSLQVLSLSGSQVSRDVESISSLKILAKECN